MSHRNHVAWPDKDVRLPELDVMRLADKLRRAQNYEEAIVILFQLRPLVRAVGILDGQIVGGPILPESRPAASRQARTSQPRQIGLRV
jgi:hypothetical protein